MTYQPLPKGWTERYREIHAYLYHHGPCTTREIVEGLKLNEYFADNSAISQTYRHLKKLTIWGYATAVKDRTERVMLWSYAYNGESEIYVNPSYEHSEYYASKRIEDARYEHSEV